jgi:hypothetical protein
MHKFLVVVTILLTLATAFCCGRVYTLKTLEILDDHHVVSMGEVHEYK